MTKTLLLASFVKKNRMQWFINHLKTNFNIDKETLFFYNILNDETKVLITFKVQVEIGERLDIKKHFRNTIQIHKKGSTLYTINALNKLIEKNSGLENGNINYKNYVVKWEDYENNLIITNSDSLAFVPISRFF